MHDSHLRDMSSTFSSQQRLGGCGSSSNRRATSSLSSRLNLAVALVTGAVLGALLQRNVAPLVGNTSSKSLRTTGGSSGLNKESEIKFPQNYASTSRGVVARLEEIPHRPTSHVDTDGRPITKQQFLEPFVVPNFVGFSVATFKPGQTMMPVHEHKSMHEFFYVLEGRGFFQVDDVTHEVYPGTFLHLASGEKHGIWVPKDSANGDLKIVVCGVTLD